MVYRVALRRREIERPKVDTTTGSLQWTHAAPADAGEEFPDHICDDGAGVGARCAALLFSQLPWPCTDATSTVSTRTSCSTATIGSSSLQTHLHVIELGSSWPQRRCTYNAYTTKLESVAPTWVVECLATSWRSKSLQPQNMPCSRGLGLYFTSPTCSSRGTHHGPIRVTAAKVPMPNLGTQLITGSFCGHIVSLLSCSCIIAEAYSASRYM